MTRAANLSFHYSTTLDLTVSIETDFTWLEMYTYLSCSGCTSKVIGLIQLPWISWVLKKIKFQIPSSLGLTSLLHLAQCEIFNCLVKERMTADNCLVQNHGAVNVSSTKRRVLMIRAGTFLRALLCSIYFSAVICVWGGRKRRKDVDRRCKSLHGRFL